MANVRVQSPTPATTAGGTSVALSWTQPTTGGNLLLAVVCQNAGTGAVIPVITAPSGWVLKLNPNDTTTELADCWLYEIQAAASRSGSESFSSNLSGDMALGLYEYSGLAGVGATDRTATGTNANNVGAAGDSGTTGTTTDTGELVFVAMGNRRYAQSGTITNAGTLTGTYTQINTASSPNGTAASIITMGAYEILNTTNLGTAHMTVGLATSERYRGAVATYVARELVLNNYQFVKVGDGMSTGERIR